ncbi:MAG TPA: hypothetical protein VLH19_01250 [Patescibacteria group bacterium]|nr:hypothetical protein [Patescibacteria group bacterium]
MKKHKLEILVLIILLIVLILGIGTSVRLAMTQEDNRSYAGIHFGGQSSEGY